MTDSMSGRARLARNNINILTALPTQGGEYLSVTFEFQYRLPSGQPVWRKTFGIYPLDLYQALEEILDDVRSLRRELENGESNQAD